MKAMRLRQPGKLDNLYRDVDAAATPGPGEVRVRLHASSLNFHDYMVVSGMAPAADGRIPLSDGAGDVIAVGAGVNEFIVGDRVISTFFPDWVAGGPPALTAMEQRVPGDTVDGYAREEVVAPESWFTRAPLGYSHAEAATLICAGLTAWRALFVEAHTRPGDTVLIQGTGGVSIFALQLAKAVGARVIATSSSAQKLERLRALGADHVINYQEEPEWGMVARKLSGQGGIDHVVEVGGAGTLAQSIEACRIGGQISMIGILTGFAGPFPAANVMLRQLRVIGITVASRAHQKDFVRALEATGIRPIIDRKFPLEEIAAAFRYQETRAHIGKICMEW